MRRLLATAAVVVAVAATIATTAHLLYAQPVGQNQISGQECWNAGQGPGGPSTGFLCVNPVSGRTANAVLSAVSGSTTIGTTTNVTVTGTPAPSAVVTGGNLLLTAQPSAATWTWPPNPIPDGAIVGVCNSTGSAFATNAQTPAANTGQTMNTTAAFTTLAAGSCVRYQWNQSNTTWYRVQ